MENVIIRRIRETIEERKKKNPSYSLRAYARQVDVPAATVSRLLAGQWPLSLTMARRLVKGISESKDEQRRLLRACVLEPEKKTSKATRYRYLELDELEQLSHWGYSAILEWLRGKKGERSEVVIAQATGLTLEETHACLQTLRKLELVERSVKNGWKSKGTHFSSIRWEGYPPWISIHRGYAMRAAKYLEGYDPEKSVVQGITFQIAPEKLAEARERIREFSEELADDLSPESQGSLYRLNLQLFPLGR